MVRSTAWEHARERRVQRVGLAVVDHHSVLAEDGHGHLDMGSGRHRLAVVQHVDALVEAGPREQQRGDELAGPRRVEGDLPAPTDPAPWTVNGNRSPDPDAEGAQGVEHLADRAGPHVGVAVEGDRSVREAGHGGTKRVTVPARPQSTSTPPVSGPGVTRQSGPEVSTAAPSEVRAPAISRVSRERGPGRRARAVGQRGEHQRAVGQRLAPRQGHDRLDRPAGVRRGPGADNRWRGSPGECSPAQRTERAGKGVS